MEVNVHEAKTNFSKLLQRVILGDEIIIAKAGVPVAKLVRYVTKRARGHWDSIEGKYGWPMTSTLHYRPIFLLGSFGEDVPESQAGQTAHQPEKSTRRHEISSGYGCLSMASDSAR